MSKRIIMCSCGKILLFIIFFLNTGYNVWARGYDEDNLRRTHDEVQFERGRMYISSPLRTLDVSLNVEIAITREAQFQGYMFRRQAPAVNEGMLFLYDLMKPRRVAIWTKNTIFPIDLVFIGKNWVVESLYNNLPIMSEKYYWSRHGVIAALELGAGENQKLGIHVGDTIKLDEYSLNKISRKYGSAKYEQELNFDKRNEISENNNYDNSNDTYENLETLREAEGAGELHIDSLKYKF